MWIDDWSSAYSLDVVWSVVDEDFVPEGLVRTTANGTTMPVITTIAAINPITVLMQHDGL